MTKNKTGMAPYGNDMKGANLGGGSMTPVKHQHQHQRQQAGGGERGEQQQQPFVLRGV